MTHPLIKEMSAEAMEIITNIRDCQELTYQQRNELMELVATDIQQKLTLAKNLLTDWTGNTYGDYPLAR